MEEYNSKKIKLEDEDDTDTVTKKYIELTPNNVKYNYSVAVNEMDKELVKLIKSKGFDLNDFKEVSMTIDYVNLYHLYMIALFLFFF